MNVTLLSGAITSANIRVRHVTGHQFIGAMLEAATPRLGGQCGQELAQLKKAFGMSLKAGDTFLMSTDGVPTSLCGDTQ